MNEFALKHVFGPVPSRRLGRSLGIDLVPYKTCSFDCIYCQLGRTVNKTLERKEYIPLDEILEEIERKRKEECEFDYITLSGSGEPTLYSRLGELVEEIKKRTSKPLAAITNGSMLWDEEVRAALLPCDVVIPSLDAGTQDYFETVNRPCSGLCLEKVVDGLVRFSKEFKGKMWLEVFLLAGKFDPQLRAKEIAEQVKRIHPTLTQLNTVARPPCESYAAPVEKEVMAGLLRYFPEPVEVIADFSVKWKSSERSADREEILRLLSRRPCKSDDLADSLGIHRLEALKVLEELVAEKRIGVKEEDHEIFYTVLQNCNDPKGAT